MKRRLKKVPCLALSHFQWVRSIMHWICESSISVPRKWPRNAWGTKQYFSDRPFWVWRYLSADRFSLMTSEITVVLSGQVITSMWKKFLFTWDSLKFMSNNTGTVTVCKHTRITHTCVNTHTHTHTHRVYTHPEYRVKLWVRLILIQKQKTCRKHFETKRQQQKVAYKVLHSLIMIGVWLFQTH